MIKTLILGVCSVLLWSCFSGLADYNRAMLFSPAMPKTFLPNHEKEVVWEATLDILRSLDYLITTIQEEKGRIMGYKKADHVAVLIKEAEGGCFLDVGVASEVYNIFRAGYRIRNDLKYQITKKIIDYLENNKEQKNGDKIDSKHIHSICFYPLPCRVMAGYQTRRRVNHGNL